MSKNAISWALYDWANSAFATVVIAGFFPLLLKNWWAADMPAPQSSFYLGAANSIASLTIVILAPLLGALADQLAWRKRILLAYAFLGILMSLCLALIPASSWILALLVFVLAVIGFSGANGLYDALLPSVAGDRVDQVSALGFALGYLGGGLLFLINVLLVMNPEWLGFSDPISIMRGSFVSVALWWAVFSLPLMLYVPEPAATAQQDCL
ncbi:MAG: MFS transporter, partial [gamma proteobacterium symbiont of Bathyaustriella thionipta]|nr:MFS transporter [gamma proteobacterium symbiont of Bathyaustriella thionipta]